MTTTAKELEVDVIPPGSPEESCTVDANLAEEADRLCFDDMATRDKVWVLHYQHGWSLRKIAKAIGVSYQALYKHRANIEADLEQAPADPQAPKRRAILRDRLEIQYARAMEVKDKERSVVLALKTIEVMAKLDGLNLEAKDDSQKVVPYAAPEEIAQEVRQTMLKRWNRPALEMASEQQPQTAGATQ